MKLDFLVTVVIGLDHNDGSVEDNNISINEDGTVLHQAIGMISGSKKPKSSAFINWDIPSSL